MSTSVDHLLERTQDATDLLGDIVPSAITLATMLRHRKMAAWLREEFDGYADKDKAPPYRRDLPGHIVAKSPQYGWIPAPVNDRQTSEFGHLDLPEGIKTLEQICLNCKKGNGNRVLLEKEEMDTLQKQINLSAELAINLSRDVYGRLLRTIRAAIHIWSDALIEAGMNGEHNHYSPEERKSVEHLDTPEAFWRLAMEQVDDLPIPDVRELGFLERMFGRTG
ncbi:hypothetical protein KUV44_07080 [Marinobacter daepoensis]|uniref:AbiTii domain-containing protein n=1 Tax=Marinobacter daepoensis TaxID=262077 RepID=A0ABS3BGY9_9GAMM|nr:hypothetical protein [Marinobacter daepoensis]MBN7771032.1 hypothetical protein [Marinobacter daepoensis]MBY6078894.1 hypothetical protein [Marinobacter daepoensis]